MYDGCIAILCRFVQERSKKGHWTEAFFRGEDLKDNARVWLSELMVLPHVSIHVLPTVNMSPEVMSLHRTRM